MQYKTEAQNSIFYSYDIEEYKFFIFPNLNFEFKIISLLCLSL